MELKQIEVQILELTAEGLKTEEVAKELLITPNAVRHRKNSVFEKLGASNMPHAVVLALKQGALILQDLSN